ncbi:MAG: aldose epimerase [Ilumatobacter sp.]|nr:aldose epimerase [Ilumatobacter sp.]
MSELITLVVDGRHGHASVDIDPAAGCRVAQITVDGHPLLVDPGARDPQSVMWGAYPMAPWAGRIRHGQFRLFGVDRELELNTEDGDGNDPNRRHALHGTVFDRAWTVETATATTVTASCPLAAPERSTPSLRHFGWTFGGTAHQTLELLDGQLCCHLSIEVDHEDHAPFLGEVGWHPWFRTPDALSFHPDAMYERDEVGLPTGRLVEPAPAPWDDCFVNTAPVTLHYGEPDLGLTLTLSSDCDHWVIYSTPDDAICCEPQSGPPDAFNIRPRLVTHTHPLRRTMNIAW